MKLRGINIPSALLARWGVCTGYAVDLLGDGGDDDL